MQVGVGVGAGVDREPGAAGLAGGCDGSITTNQPLENVTVPSSATFVTGRSLTVSNISSGPGATPVTVPRWIADVARVSDTSVPQPSAPTSQVGGT